MNRNIHHILEQGEGISIEFKKSSNALPESFFETVCAFLNRNGGAILLGVNDDKTISGIQVKTAELLCKQIANFRVNCDS